jgi:glucosamine--fructose-6-phosphate aminotransferase (isomerizing)
LKAEPLDGYIGIGHTRWATHGVPNETNAHPHFSNGVAIVHNGIIENFAELRDELMVDGYDFKSQTDTEVVAHLVAREIARGFDPVKASFNALKRLEGAFALAIMFRGDEDLIVGARNGRRSRSAMAKARCFSVPMRSRWRPSPIRSPTWKTATGR